METPAHGERAVRHGSYVIDDYGRASLYLTEMFFGVSHGSSLVRLIFGIRLTDIRQSRGPSSHTHTHSRDP